MQYEAVQEAYRALARARNAASALEKAQWTQEFFTVWADFLVASNDVYTKLRVGANVPKSKNWFGRRVRERRTDPLLIYIHQARHAEQHNVGSTAEFEPTRFEVPMRDFGAPPKIGRVSIKKTIYLEGLDMKERIDSVEIEGDPELPRWTPAESRLLPAHNTEYGDTFAPPKEHLGKPIEDGSAVGVAKLALQYLDAMVSDARAQFAATPRISY